MPRTERRYYKIKALPGEIDRELEIAAKAAGMPVSTAFQYILYGADLAAAIRRGQELAREAQERSAEEPDAPDHEDKGLHMTPDSKRLIVDAARALGVNLGVVGRFLLMTHQGNLGAMISAGLNKRIQDGQQ